MSAIHGIAWGLVEITPENFKMLRRAVREELRTHRMSLQPTTSGNYVLIQRRHGFGKSRGSGKHRIGWGDFKNCCDMASKVLTPPKNEST